MKRFIATTLSVIYLLSLPIIFGNLDLAIAQSTPATMSMTWADGTGTAIPLGINKEFKVNINVNTGGLASEGFDIAIDYSSTEATYEIGSLSYTTFYNGQTVPSNGEVDSSTSGKLRFGKQGAAKTGSGVVASLIFVAASVTGSATLLTNSYITGATGDNVSVYNSPGLEAPIDLLSAKPSPVTFTFSAAVATPTISNLNPNHGVAGGGTSVIITGTNFGGTKGTSDVRFGSTSVTTTAWSDTSITATSPSGTAGNSVIVTVVTSAGTSGGATFTYDTTGSTVPVISGINPNHGPAAGGTSVVITGTNFGGTKGTSDVRFGSTSVTTTTWSDTYIIATSSSGTAGNSVIVTVVTSAGASSGVPFTYDSTTTADTGMPMGVWFGLIPLNGVLAILAKRKFF